MGVQTREMIGKAVQQFWDTRSTQGNNSTDKSNRGSVTGGKQMDGFVELLRHVALKSGVPTECIYTKGSYLPGYFRSSKDWDFLVVSPSGKLLAVAELKSQVGSYGNNFNNRTEEAIGSAVDLWTAFRENQFPNQLAPWVGYLMVVGDDKQSNTAVRNHEQHYKVRPEFQLASYKERYCILCQKLVQERHYTAAALLATKADGTYSDVSRDVAITVMLQSLEGYLKGVSHEFK